jgi:hypothetical protein
MGMVSISKATQQFGPLFLRTSLKCDQSDDGKAQPNEKAEFTQFKWAF